jgi:predicted RND superfamily exporter protein
MSVTWTLALAYAFYGSLNLFSSVSCAIIVGLSADYGIHLYSEYLRHRERGDSSEASFLSALHKLRRPFFVAATTTSAAFFSLSLSRFKAFSEFGMIAGPGILLCAIAFAFIFPSLTLCVEKIWPEKMRRLPFETQNSDSFISKFGFKFSSFQWIFSLRGALIIGLLLLAPLLTLASGRFYFDYNANHILGTQPTKALDSRVDAIFSNSVNPEVAFVERAADAAPFAEALRRVQAQSKTLPHGTTIKSVLALPDFVPDRQTAKIQKIAEIRGLFNERIVKALGKEDRESYRKFKAMLNPSTLTLASLPDKIVNKFRDRKGKEGRIIFIFPNFSVNHSDTFMRYTEEIRAAECTECVGERYVSGESTVFYEIVMMLFSEGKYVMGFALVAVFLLLWLNFRSLQDTCLVMAPLLFSLIALVGCMSLLGLPLNIINLAAFPIILGVVTDYVVHFYQRYREDHGGSVTQAYSESFRPILGSTLTTLIGFGALLFADMGGLRSLGGIAFLGVLLGSVTTLFWFPGLLSFFSRAAESKLAHVKEAESQIIIES